MGDQGVRVVAADDLSAEGVVIHACQSDGRGVVEVLHFPDPAPGEAPDASSSETDVVKKDGCGHVPEDGLDVHVHRNAAVAALLAPHGRVLCLPVQGGEALFYRFHGTEGSEGGANPAGQTLVIPGQTDDGEPRMTSGGPFESLGAVTVDEDRSAQVQQQAAAAFPEVELQVLQEPFRSRSPEAREC